MGYTITPFNPYPGLANTVTPVTFNGIEWYVIADGSTAVNAGTVTLLAKESFGKDIFGSDNVYSNSSVKHYLDSLTEKGNSFWSVAYAIADTDLTDVGVTGAKLYLLSADEAGHVLFDIRKFPQATENLINNGRMFWWLRTPGEAVRGVSSVDGYTGGISTYGDPVRAVSLEIRPALRLNLSSVVFSSESNTFSLRQDHTHSFAYSASGATITAVCSAPDCTLSNSRAKLTIVKPEHAVFGDGKSAEATITGSINGIDLPSVVYQKGTENLTAAPADAGNYKASITLGNATASVEYEISKAAQAAPAAPTAESVTGNSVTLKKTAGYQYSMDGTNWQDSPVFTGLAMNTEYTFYQRIAGDANHEFSPASPGTAITTGSIAYTVTENQNAEYTVGSGVDIVFTVKRNVNDEDTFKNYSGATVDGKAIPDGGSTAKAGSLILTLKSSYLDTLSVGDHKVTISFKDGTVEASLKIKAAAPEPSPSVYTVTENKNAEYTVGSGVDIVYTVKRNVNDEETFKNYSGATVDGKAIPDGGSTAKPGSLILTLKSSYLDTLSVGDHKVTISFKDGTAEAPLKIKAAAPKPSKVPKTGDTADFPLWIGLVLLGLIGISLLELTAQKYRK